MAPYSTCLPTSQEMICFGATTSVPHAATVPESEPASIVEKQCYSHHPFEDYDYEQELDRWLTADPYGCFPDFYDVPRAACSERSADARLISEALAESSDDSTLLYCLSDTTETSSASTRAAPEKESEEITGLLGCSTSNESSTFVPCTGFTAAQAAESDDGPSTSTSESASNSPRSERSVFCASSRLTSSSSYSATAFSHKTGGPCDHCGATESPQWRRGPPAKPMLCNACGTRYRRTHQLGSFPGARGGKGGSLPGRKRRAAARELADRCKVSKQKTLSLVVCAA